MLSAIIFWILRIVMSCTSESQPHIQLKQSTTTFFPMAGWGQLTIHTLVRIAMNFVEHTNLINEAVVTQRYKTLIQINSSNHTHIMLKTLKVTVSNRSSNRRRVLKIREGEGIVITNLHRSVYKNETHHPQDTFVLGDTWPLRTNLTLRMSRARDGLYGNTRKKQSNMEEE